MLQDRDSPHAERLRAELKAIELWDDAYRRSPSREWWETAAFQSRQQRRNEILVELQRELGRAVKKVPLVEFM